MGWLENEQRGWAGEVAVDALWRSVEVQPVEGVPPAVERYLAELRRLYVNGGVDLARFVVRGDADFDWFASRGRWEELALFAKLLTHPGVRQAWPEMVKGVRQGKLAFEPVSSLMLDGWLADLLVSGGAYYRFEGPPQEAKQLGAEVCRELFGDRYLEVQAFQCWKPWSPWVLDVAWDGTLLLIDRREQTVSLLCATDTD